jgi:hypothetical protein
VERANRVLGGIDLRADVRGRAAYGSLLEFGDGDWTAGSPSICAKAIA